MALEYGLGVSIFLNISILFFPYAVGTHSDPRCHPWGVLIFWCDVSLAHAEQFSWGCRVDELAHLLVLSRDSLLMGFLQFAWCVQVLQFICAQNPLEIPYEICVWSFIYMRGKWLNTCFQLRCGSSKLSFNALVQALAGQDGDASWAAQIMQLLLLILLNDTSFAAYPFSNIHVFQIYSQWTVCTWM